MLRYLKHIALLWGIFFVMISGFVYANPQIHTITPNTENVELFTKFELRVTLSATYSNPYDYNQVRLKGYFTSPSGEQTIWDGFYMQDYEMTQPDVLVPSGPPQWRIRFSPDETGTWTYFVRIWDETGFEHSENLQFTCTPSNRKGFVSRNGNRMVHQNGVTFLGIGTNMAWQDWSTGFTDYEDWLDELAENGGNFTKLTMAPWNFEIEWKQTGVGQYDERQNRAWTLDWVMDMLMEHEIYCQLNPMIHAELRVGMKWHDNPYSDQNGGPCHEPQNFFVNTEAIRLYKQKLRYINARWGYSPQVISWEQLSEADNTGLYSSFYDQTLLWSNIMTEYMGEVDRYNRPCSNGYAIPQHDPGYWGNPQTGFTQLHVYDFIPDLEMKIYNFSRNYMETWNKPFLTGEFALGHDPSEIYQYDPDGIAFHNTVWSSMFSGSFGTAMSWWWDNYLYPNDLYDHLKAVSDFRGTIDKDISQLEPAVLLSTSADYDMLEIDPDYNNDGGKAPENYFHFEPSGLLSPTELYLGEYLYGSFYNTRRNPPTFKVNYTQDGEFKVKVGNLALFSKLRIRLNGNTIFNQNVSTNSLYSVFIPAGEHEIKVDNSSTGAMKINEYEFHEYAPTLRTFVFKDEEYAAGWMQNRRYNWHYLNYNGIPGPVEDGKIYPGFETNGTYEIAWYNQDAQLDSMQTIIFTGDEMVIDAPDILWDGAFEITFIAPVQHAFSADPVSGYLPLAVQFTDESTVFGTQIDEWYWDFGDGNTSTSQNPQHIYQQEGVYSVSLEIVADGYSITLAKENLIEVIQPLVADFTSDTTIAVPNESIQFYDLSLGDPNSWMWSFGDNTLSFARNPQHLFEDPGLYSISLLVQNQNGSDIVTKSNYIQIILPLATAFSVDKGVSTVGGEIQFIDNSTGNPDWWHWDFGDGTVSNQQNPAKAYTYSGNFSVNLVSGNQFFQDSLFMEDLITILEPLDADFFAQPLSVWQGDEVQFSDLSSGNPDTWYWEFGDGNHAAVQHPGHVYTNGGFYSVSLVISDTLQADSIVKENYIHVRDTLDADFVADTTVITKGEKVYFNDVSKGDPESWFWLFGDGFASSLQNPAHRFKFASDFTVTLQVSRNDSTDVEIKSEFIKVLPHLVAGFAVDTIYAIPGEMIHFTDKSTGNPDAWIWDFGDATVGTGQNPVKSYAYPGSYSVTLMASNDWLSDTLVKENLIHIIEPLEAGFSLNPYEGKIGEEIAFIDQTTGFPDHWEWWFGNGDTAYVQNPATVYYEPGFYDVSLIAGNEFFSDTLVLDDVLHIEPPYYSQDIPISEGWSGISTYVQPVFSDVTEIFAPMLESLSYAMNQQGIYIPDLGINTIQFWDVSQGMIVYTIQPDTLTIAGYSVVDNEMSLPAGWSFLPVISPCAHQTDQLKSVVGENLKVIKEIGGNKVYWPEMFIETLNIIRPGEMYLIYMESEKDFTFPACD